MLLLLLACHGPADALGPAPAVAPAAPALRRLTGAQYERVVVDLLGEGLALPTALEPDTEAAGLLSVGAAVTSLSALGVERYEAAALSLAEQVVADPARYAAVVGCEPATVDDRACAESFVRAFGRRAWRRPLTDEEVERLVALLTTVGAESGDFATGVRYTLVAILQSPHFLYRREHGEEQGDRRRLVGPELATRLAFTLWNTTPDEPLLDAAEAGELDDPEGLAATVDAMLADPRAREGVANLWTEALGLWELDDLDKDPTVYTHASDELGPAAREETLRVVDHLVFTEDADLRALLTTRTTFVDPRLAALYAIPAPSLDGFAETTLDAEGGRRGFLGHASFLMLQAHATRSSATLRGKFIRTRLLCQVIPSPPAGVDTSIPEVDADAPTLRDRIGSHLEDPTCAACHAAMDPIGLGLENFDGIGRWRDTENGAPIDASGELDGVAFADAWELGGVVRDHERVGLCFTTHLYQYATGHPLGEGEEALRDWLAEGLEAEGGSWVGLTRRLATSEGFTTVGALD